MARTYVYEIENPGEFAAGIRGFSDTISIIVDSGSPGGDDSGPDSFQEFMLQALREWYPDAGVAYTGRTRLGG